MPIALALSQHERLPLVRDTTVQEELARLEEDDLFEMANLGEDQTGISGTIFISTRMGQHAARVKFFDGRPGNSRPSYSVTICETPEVVATSLPDHVVNATSPRVKEWVRLNQELLMRLWDEGTEMMDEEIDRLKADLQRV